MKGSGKEKDQLVNLYVDDRPKKLMSERQADVEYATNYRKKRISLKQKLALFTGIMISVGAVAVALGLHFGVSQQGTINNQIPQTVDSTEASLIKINSSGEILKTTNDEQVGILLTTGGEVTGALTTTRAIASFQNNELVSRSYVDSLLGGVAVDSNDLLATRSYVEGEIQKLALLSPSDTNRNTFTGAVFSGKPSGSTLLDDEFVTKEYTDNVLNGKLLNTGGSLTGAITTGKVVADFLNPAEFITKQYVDENSQLLNTQLTTFLDTSLADRVPLAGTAVGAPLTGPVTTNQDTFADDDLVDKEYTDSQINPLLIRPLNYLDTNPIIGSAEGSYQISGTNTCNLASITGWRTNPNALELTDATRGLNSPAESNVIGTGTTAVPRRGFLNYFGVDYDTAKLIEKYPENVRIAFRVRDARTGTAVDRVSETRFFDLLNLNATNVAVNLMAPDGTEETYNIIVTYDNVNKTIMITDSHVGAASCYGAIDAIVLSGYVPSLEADRLSANPLPAVTPVFRTS